MHAVVYVEGLVGSVKPRENLRILKTLLTYSIELSKLVDLCPGALE
jgi:hypothetical protein